MRYLTILLFTFAVFYTIGFTQPGYAIDPHKEWVVECQNSAEKRIRNYEKGVNKFKILENSLVKTKSTDTKKVLEGTGKFSNYDDQWKDFTFKCVYDKEANEVAKVSYDVKGYSSGYNDGQYTKRVNANFGMTNKTTLIWKVIAELYARSQTMGKNI